MKIIITINDVKVEMTIEDAKTLYFTLMEIIYTDMK